MEAARSGEDFSVLSPCKAARSGEEDFTLARRVSVEHFLSLPRAREMDDDTRRGSSAIYRTLRGFRSVSLRTKHSIDRLLVVGLRPQASAPTTPNTRTLVSPTRFGERIPCGGEVGGILLCGDRGPPAPEQDPTRSGRLPIITDGRFRYISCSLCLLSENTKYKKLFSPSLPLSKIVHSR